MENNEFKDEQQEIYESFICCVCLDLLYKPIVLACGHVSCFWCVHKSMNDSSESHCPTCRHTYYHFPTICQLLHFLLLKTYPAAYKRRENQTLEEEEEEDCFSPQFICDRPENSPTSTTINQTSNSCSTESLESMEQSRSANHNGDEGIISVEGKKLPQNEHNQQPKILVADLTCPMCKQMLIHPVGLNCGHVYCETCITDLPHEVLICQVCQSPHPGGFPKVCLALDQFLEEQFPEEYTLRRDAIQPSQIKVQPETTSSCSLSKDNGEIIALGSNPELLVHEGAGCDFCGMYPIIGDRYKCVDCKEIIGFDLCGDCYKNRAKRPGRFNQKHTPDHKLELVLADDTDFSDLELVQDEDDTDSSDLIVIQYDTDSSTDEE
ncbi:E3 ubiquitin-protein ligase PRT1-like [Trifolium pratense]|nr:E3 ubiquitin-protein ligase PRT1-like [Trifolium pratense]XP_045828559.1 E3 ubiquitin-protein ligase PRT1-like [Trifolium pratense]XP_045828561.1 E3 ubiquitin-protein ligase PRT1-like [Trifolium pratense]